jgi:hypothetical protein
VVEVEESSKCEDSAGSLETVDNVQAREYPAAGLSFESPMISTSSDDEAVGGFVVPKCYASLYTKIWKRYGHIATTEAWKGFPPTLLTTVAGMLPIIEEMDQMRLRDVKNHELRRWDEMTSNCELLRFNIGWLRRRLEIIKVHKAAEAADAISMNAALLDEERVLALESAKVEKAVEDLKVKTKAFQKKLDEASFMDYPLLDGLL